MNRVLRTIIWCLVLILTLAQLSNSAEIQTPRTLEEMMAAPHISRLLASPAGDRVAWVINYKGQKSLWVAEGPKFEGRRLVTHPEDDSLDFSDPQFTADGSALVYVFGSSFNPTSRPKLPEHLIMMVDLQSGKERLLVKGTNPLISPDGKNLLFMRAGEPYLLPLSGGSEPKRLFQARGRNHSLSWSPDGKKVLFVSSREAHSFIGVYDLERDEIRWLLPDVYRDLSPVWSPDGKRVAFLRLPPGKDLEKPLSRRSDVPFSIWVVDVESGRGKKVVELSRGGGFAQTYPSNPLVWATEDRLVFYSEHTGWMHLYSVSVETGEMVALTEGQYEVEQMTLSPDRKLVVFNSNCGDLERRHLWKVQVKSGKPEPLTDGNSVEWAPVVSADGQKLFFLQSTPRRPGIPVMMEFSGKVCKTLVNLAQIAPEFKEDRLVEPQTVTFQAKDGMVVHGQLFLPKSIKKGEKLPAVIFMHGGPIRQMYPAWHHSPYYHNCYAFNQYLAQSGYVVLSVNFRCGIGYGVAFREAENQGPEGASEYQDILAAADYLKSLPQVDDRRIGLWGGSYGGYLTALGLARNSEVFAAGVDFHGVHDWALRGRRRNGGGWGIFEAQQEIAYKSSPVANVEKWRSVLFVHGDDDRNVDFIQTTDLVARLKELDQAQVETLVFPDEVHSFLLHKNWVKAFSAASEFFDRYLKQRKIK